MIFWAANPPGSLDFTYFSKLIPSNSAVVGANAPPTTAATAVDEEDATIVEGRCLRRSAALGRDLIRGRARVCGFEAMWEEKERDENGEMTEKREVAAMRAFSPTIVLKDRSS